MFLLVLQKDRKGSLCQQIKRRSKLEGKKPLKTTKKRVIQETENHRLCEKLQCYVVEKPSYAQLWEKFCEQVIKGDYLLEE